MRVYGLDRKNETICVQVDDFNPYVYIEIPDNWDTQKRNNFRDNIDSVMGYRKNTREKISMVEKKFVRRKKLYYANFDANGDIKKFSYLRCSFCSQSDKNRLSFKAKCNIDIPNVGTVNVRMHEQDANPVLQLCCMQGIPTTGWINIKNSRQSRNPTTLCSRECTSSWCDICPISGVCNSITSPLIMGFDIEAYSQIPTAMPDAQKDDDCIFQISCVFAREESEKTCKKYLITIGDVNDEKISEGDMDSEFTTIRCSTEREILEKFTDIVNELNPNIMVGYNIFSFDIPYMIERSEKNNCFSHFSKIGFNRRKGAKIKNIKWSSSAYKDQQFQFLDAEGRLFIDLLPVVKRDYKMDNYRLKTVSTYFLGETKDPLSVRGIFRAFELYIKSRQHEENYRILMKEYDDMECDNQVAMDEMFEKTEHEFTRMTHIQIRAKNALSICGKYCIQDSALVVKLMFKLQTWISLCEMAAVCYVQPLTLYTQGQQIKVFSQIYKYCYDNEIVVEHDAYNTKENERYMGAYVFEPVAGLYEHVVPFDFNSLYPTTIIAYNIDYSTLVLDESIPDEKCHVMEWDEHNGCEHDPKMIRKAEIDDILLESKTYLTGLRELKKRDKKKKVEIDEEIECENKRTKPHREERAEISKTRPKMPMCAHRKYRFIREPSGVLPMILKHLLDSRKKTRQLIKEYKNEMRECSDERRKELELVIIVLEKRQLSYKVSANSAYGAMGVKKGYLPFMPGAMTTTYKGRQNIEIVAKTIAEKFKGRLIYGDTDCVVENTPVLIKCNDGIKYVPISELSDEKWFTINCNKEISKPKPNRQIWSDGGWTNIANVVRCGINKPIANIYTPIGCVFCSSEHSLLTNHGKAVTPLDMNNGDFLRTYDLPVRRDMDFFHSPETETQCAKVSEAFVLGSFFRYGLCCVSMTPLNPWFWWCIRCCDEESITECSKTLKERHPNLNFEVNVYGKITSLCLIHEKCDVNYTHAINFVKNYVKKFYGENGDTIVPDEIMNGSMVMQKYFLRGCCGKTTGDIKISSLSALGAAGLFFVLRSLGYACGVKECDHRYTLSTCGEEIGDVSSLGVVEKIVFKKYDGKYLYDIQTENHHFSAGVGELVVHNSNYINFPHLNDTRETWDYANMVADEVSKMFPPPMRLEFEEVIYWNFFILTKKRYMYNSCQKDGIVSDKVGRKGVLLVRRDNSQFVRDVYEQVIKQIFKHSDVSDVLYLIVGEINKMCSGCVPVKNFVITKAVGDVDKLNVTIIHDEEGNINTKIGKYKVPTLAFDEKGRIKQLKKKDASNETEFYTRSLPAHVQLAQRIRDRGGRVDTGSRLEYVITETGGHNANQSVKIEDIEYFINHRDILRIDFLYYLKLLTIPLDQVIKTAFRIDNFTQEQYNIRLNRKKVHDELLNLFRPKLKFFK